MGMARNEPLLYTVLVGEANSFRAMAYIENPFRTGQYAQCINDNFPVVETTGDKSQIGTHPLTHPKKGEICCVDEILGEFLRFDEYDCNDETSIDYGYKWWKRIRYCRQPR